VSEALARSAALRLPLGLAVATLATTLWAGLQGTDAWAWRSGARTLLGFDLSGHIGAPWLDPAAWRDGLSFSLGLLSILWAHEMGHWLMARRHRVPTSLPLFIPFLPPLGTMGAIITMPPVTMPARVLLRIAAAGPIAGMVVAVPLYLVGLSWSEHRPLPGIGAEPMLLGAGLLMQVAEAAMHGPPPVGHDLFLHPLAFAAWAGFWVTALNMMPLGQLDGGHVAYAMFGPRWNAVARLAPAALFVLGLFGGLFWWVIGGLVAWSMGLQHPDNVSEPGLDGRDRLWAFGAWMVWLLTFMPTPFPDPMGPPIRWIFGS
jgi:membrane-associated protease RseP (regulator of RpoE activity)